MSTEASVSTTWKHPDRIRPAALPGAVRVSAALDRLGRRRGRARDASGRDRDSSRSPATRDSRWSARRSASCSAAQTSRGGCTTVTAPSRGSSRSGSISVMALGPDATQSVLVNADKAYSQSGWEWFIGPFFKRGLMLLDFDEHLMHRRIMQEAFTRPRLNGYLERTDELVAKDVAGWPARRPDVRLPDPEAALARHRDAHLHGRLDGGGRRQAADARSSTRCGPVHR